MSERWEGFIDYVDDGCLWLRLFAPDGEKYLASMNGKAFKAPIEPHEIREGLLFFWDIDATGIKWSIPPRYTQEELDKAHEDAASYIDRYSPLFEDPNPHQSERG